MENRIYRVLLIEDDEDDYFMIKEVVREVSDPELNLDWAPTFGEGKRRLLEGSYDICLLDYRLGGQTGLDLLKEAIAANVLVPIILLTGYGDEEVEHKAMTIGAAAYVVKGEITVPFLERVIRYSIYRGRTQTQILQQDRLASVGLLASGLAHEIGTPLGVVRGRAEYALMNLGDRTTVEKNLNVILAEIDRISKLIRSLLNLARGADAGELGQVSISKVIDDVLILMSHEFRKNRIAVDNAVPPATSIGVRAEAESLHQVILNLLVNSVHAIETAAKNGQPGERRIRLSAVSTDQGWVLSVQDTGCGISPANMKSIFKPFFTTKEVGKGTGLGLATSYNILKSWGGELTAESEQGVGSTFRLRIPR